MDVHSKDISWRCVIHFFGFFCSFFFESMDLCLILNSWRQSDFAKNCFGFKDFSWRTFLGGGLILQRIVLGLRNFLGHTFKGHLLEVCNAFFWIFFVLFFFLSMDLGLISKRHFLEVFFKVTLFFF